MPALTKRIHQTEKPLGVMRDICRIVEPGGIILDPFAGSGTTVLAAKLEGYPSVGIELSPHYAHAAYERVLAGLADEAAHGVVPVGEASGDGAGVTAPAVNNAASITGTAVV